MYINYCFLILFISALTFDEGQSRSINTHSGDFSIAKKKLTNILRDNEKRNDDVASDFFKELRNGHQSGVETNNRIRGKTNACDGSCEWCCVIWKLQQKDKQKHRKT